MMCLLMFYMRTFVAQQGFPLGVDLRGDILGKMAKNCMKITKSTFWGQSNERHGGGDKPIFEIVGDSLTHVIIPMVTLNKQLVKDGLTKVDF